MMITTMIIASTGLANLMRQAAPLKISQLNEAAIKAVSDGDLQVISLQKSNDFVCLAIR